jgi:ABC-type bacteriocin/lantibiotic exporter with double-glycine peptidase domain
MVKSVSPVQRLFALIAQDKQDLIVLLIYTVFSGVLSLILPVAAQALVNTIAAGVFLQPLVVLTLLVFIGLLFAGAIRVLQVFLVEILQQRVFVRTAMGLATRIPLIQYGTLLKDYPPELINRFFDVVVIQKTMAKILLEWPSSVLQIAVGLTLMAFYSPVLLAFDIFVILAFFAISFGLGFGALRTSISESQEKYHVAGWLEEIARCHVAIKSHGNLRFFAQRADAMVLDYLTSRREHFRILFRQAIAHYFFQALASAIILGIGGWLVIHKQLTLGQLVASELIIVGVLAALEKLVNKLGDFYDLLTALDKVGQLEDLPIEDLSAGEQNLLRQAPGLRIEATQLNYAYRSERPVLKNLSFRIEAGERLVVVGFNGSGKSTLARILSGLLTPDSGGLAFDSIDYRNLSLASLWQESALAAGKHDIFEGTILDNVLMGRENIPFDDVRWALNLVELWDELHQLPKGLNTALASTGYNLSKGVLQRLLLARAILDRPRLLVLDEDVFTSLDENIKIQIVERLVDPSLPWTLVCFAHDTSVLLRASRVLVMHNGEILALDTPKALLNNPSSLIHHIFPELSQWLKQGGLYS